MKPIALSMYIIYHFSVSLNGAESRWKVSFSKVQSKRGARDKHIRRIQSFYFIIEFYAKWWPRSNGHEIYFKNKALSDYIDKITFQRSDVENLDGFVWKQKNKI